MDLETVNTDCCIAGGGPAGMMLGFLLARAGVNVVVLEKHADFLRDFRGDTIHPSTLELMFELGLLEEFLQRPHQQLSQVSGDFDGIPVPVADFAHLPTHSKFIAFMPQWDFLNFLAEKAKQYTCFDLRMEAEVIGLLEENGRVVGVQAKSPQGNFEVRADLTIGADGRHSTVRKAVGFQVMDLGAPIDVLWMRISREPGDPNRALGRSRAGKILITLNRDEYWQCAYVIPKGAFAALKEKGLPAFRQDLAEIAPFLESRTNEITDWSKVSLLSVSVDRLREWSRPGLLCIGDSAHAMSPVGGVGINLAIQDAVAAANVLASPLLRGKVETRHLHQVESRRRFPTRMTQRTQVFIHRHFLSPALSAPRAPLRRLPLPLHLLQRFPWLRRIPARVIGLGFRPEHIHTPRQSSTSAH